MKKNQIFSSDQKFKGIWNSKNPQIQKFGGWFFKFFKLREKDLPKILAYFITESINGVPLETVNSYKYLTVNK